MSITDDDYLSILFRCDTLGQTYAQVAISLGTSRSAISGAIKRMRDAWPQVEAAGLTDNQVKTILDRMFFGRSLAASIAKDFACTGLSRMAVLYLCWRVMNDLCAAGEDLTAKPENADVMDWPGWWRVAQGAGVAA